MKFELKKIFLNKEYRSIIFVALTSILSIMVSLVNGFFVPKYLSMENYAYYKTYVLYSAYVSIFQFGYINGIYLKYGGEDYENLSQGKFRAYFKLLFCTQFFITLLLIILLSIFSKMSNVKTALLFVCLNVLFININLYFSSINQITKKFKQDSKIIIFQNIFVLILFGIIFIYGGDDFVLFLTVITLSNAIASLIQAYQHRKIVFGKSEKVSIVYKEILTMLPDGFMILLSEMMSLIILGVDRIFIERLFTLKDFAMYSFAVSIMGLMYTIVNSLSKVLFPYLKRMNKDKLGEMFKNLQVILILIGGLSMLGYFVIKAIVAFILPEYNESVQYLAVLFPTVIFKALISLIHGNYFKALNLSKAYTFNNAGAVFLALSLNLIFYFIFKTPQAIAWASLISFIVWYMFGDIYLSKKMKIGFKIDIVKYFIIGVILTLFGLAV